MLRMSRVSPHRAPMTGISMAELDDFRFGVGATPGSQGRLGGTGLPTDRPRASASNISLTEARWLTGRQGTGAPAAAEPKAMTQGAPTAEKPKATTQSAHPKTNGVFTEAYSFRQGTGRVTPVPLGGTGLPGDVAPKNATVWVNKEDKFRHGSGRAQSMWLGGP